MQVRLDDILKLNDNKKSEVLVLFDKRLKVGQKLFLMAITKQGIKVTKWAKIEKLSINCASTSTPKYNNVTFVSC